MVQQRTAQARTWAIHHRRRRHPLEASGSIDSVDSADRCRRTDHDLQYGQPKRSLPGNRWQCLPKLLDFTANVRPHGAGIASGPVQGNPDLARRRRKQPHGQGRAWRPDHIRGRGNDLRTQSQVVLTGGPAGTGIAARPDHCLGIRYRRQRNPDDAVRPGGAVPVREEGPCSLAPFAESSADGMTSVRDYRVIGAAAPGAQDRRHEEATDGRIAVVHGHLVRLRDPVVGPGRPANGRPDAGVRRRQPRRG